MSDWAELRRSRVLAEDEMILALNKPTGIAVTGDRHETDLVRMAQAAGERLMPVHRIDKVTSGAVLFAKDVAAHGALTRQFNRRAVDKVYLVITRSSGLPRRGIIDLPLSVGRKNAVRVAASRSSILFGDRIGSHGGHGHWWVDPSAVFTEAKNYPSVTRFVGVWADEAHSLLVVAPTTGRRHQIRVHLAWIGHPIEGDPLFDRRAAATGARTHLHSWRLGLAATWAPGGRLDVEAPPDDGFWEPIRERLPGGIAATMRGAARALGEL